jgi:protein involved in polysaccharide export with SLBB domain
MILVLLSLIAQVSSQPYLRPEAEIEERTVAVDFIYDGDTFRGADGTDYRLAGINAPEVAHPEHGKPDGEPGGDESTDALREFIGDRNVTALIDRANPRDRYGRTVAIVIAGAIDVNLEQVRRGHAEVRYVDLSPMIDEAVFRQFASVSSPQASDTISPAPDVTGHILGPGDRVRVVVGPQSEDFAVNPDGEILIRGLGVVRIGGLTASSATANLDSAIRAKGITVSPITVFYLAPPARVQRNIVILGAVRKSGTYPATTLLGAVSAAEGFAIDANPIEVRVTAGETTILINATEILAGTIRDITLSGGEVIVVPSLPRVLVSGAVAKPNWVTALTLTEAVSAAGGPIPEADLERTEVRNRIDTPTRVNLQSVFSGIADDLRLDDRARVTIPTRPRAITPLVQVYGPVERPGTTEAFTLADAIREAQPDTRADLANVILERTPGDTTTLNAREIALGHALDTDLAQGDRVLIPRRPEATADTPQTVTVLGDVAKPGQYPPGTLTQLLAAAGGPANTARLSAIHVRHPDGRSQTLDLTRVTSGRQPDPTLAANATVFVESDEPRRQSMNDLRTFIGIISTVALLGLRLSL